VHLRFNERTILSLLEGGFISYEHDRNNEPGLYNPYTM
jgi:hypothetical protein